MRTHPNGLVRLATSTVALAGLLFPVVSLAQGAVDGEFTVQRYEPAVGPRNYLTVEGARTNGTLAWSAGLGFDYANSPFVVRSCVSATDCDAPNVQSSEEVTVVEHLFTWNLMGSFTPVPWVQIGLRVPLAYAAGDGLPGADGAIDPDAAISAFGLGDPWLEGKFRIYGEPTDLFVLGGAVDLQAPLGHATADGSYIGNSSPIVVGGRAIVDLDFGAVGAALNLKGIWREDASIGGSTIGPEFRYGAAVGYEITENFRAMVETYGATRFSSVVGTNSLEVGAGIEFKPSDLPMAFKLGGGAGVLRGIGVPTGRVTLDVAWISEGSDGDADGIADDEDQCPTKAEDLDGLADEDGCPEDDVDKDKILDEKDKCPTEPETINGLEDEDGCPDEVSDSDGDGIVDSADVCPNEPGTMRTGNARGCADTDKDGVADKFDKCPEEQEDTDGYEDTDGCPDLDNDGDGVPDLSDECDGELETINGILDTDGCPDAQPDKDGDGIGDTADQCVDKPETLNNVKDEDGCPEPRDAVLATVSASGITLSQKPVFAGEGLANEQARNIVAAAANGLQNHVEIPLVRVTVVVPAAESAYAPARMAAVLQVLTDRGLSLKRIKLETAEGSPGDVRFQILGAGASPYGESSAPPPAAPPKASPPPPPPAAPPKAPPPPPPPATPPKAPPPPPPPAAPPKAPPPPATGAPPPPAPKPAEEPYGD